ncbi:MAG: hypothetical protein WC635_17070 [Bacteriovorax sp.]|jgi:hypothetical protein
MRTFFLICIVLLVFTGCSSRKVKTEVQKEVASEPAASSNTDLYQTEMEVLSESENITADQKNQLRLLLQKSRMQSNSIDSEIMKTKSVLFKSLLSDKKNNSKINLLENQLLKLNRQKTRQTLNSYREAQSILGKNQFILDRTLNLIDNKTIHEF